MRLKKSVKKVLKITAAAAVVCAGIFACYKIQHSKEEETIELSYEPADMSEYKWIDKNNVADFRKIDVVESFRPYRDSGTCLIYYGYTNCHWCQRAIPVLNEVAKKYNVPIYYVDVSQQISNENYEQLINYTKETLEKDENDEYEFLVPVVYGIRKGKIVDYHISLVDSFEFKTFSDEEQLDEYQTEELYKEYEDIVKAAYK